MTEKMLCCPACGEQNPADHRCCKECGARLDRTGEAMAEQVLTILKRELRDQKVVELEVSEAILERVSGWAKLFGFFVALPLALLLATLTIWGVSSFADFKLKMTEAGQKLDQASTKAKELETSSAQLDLQYQRLKDQAVRYEALGQEVQSLRTDVSKLQEKVGVTAGSAVTAQQRSTILSQLTGFQRYCQRLGYTAPAGTLKVDVKEKSKMMANALAYFDTTTNTAVISKDAVDDIGIVLQQYSHIVLTSKNRNTSGATFTEPYFQIERGLSVYFPASFLENSKVAQRDLDGVDGWKTNAKYVDENEQSVAAMLWAARKQVTDKETFDRKLLQAWFDVTPQYRDPGFAAVFSARIISLLGPTDGSKVRGVFVSRGFPV
jgi:outer membrane murein-binding lipoprotein Lpp